METKTAGTQQEALRRRFLASIDTACRGCASVLLATHNQSSVYPGFCKSCGSEKWSHVVRNSVDRRISRHVGLKCRECESTELTVENQSRTYPGVCRSCYNKRSSTSLKQSRPQRLKDVLNATCRACGLETLSEETQSRSLIGYCKPCASLYFHAKRYTQIAAFTESSASCRECDTPLSEANISKSHPSICKSCQNVRHAKYVNRTTEKYLNTDCKSCGKVVLTTDNQSKTNPRYCNACVYSRNKLTFEGYLTLPCSKCGTTLTRENQSKGHLGKCKSCRNAEQLCSVCGNRGGVYKGKRCKPCKDAASS